MKTQIITKVIILLTVALIMTSKGLIAETIQSTPTGGLWSAGTTWIGGISPDLSDDVVINGIVSVDVNASCNNLTVNSSGVLRNYISSNYTLNVNGDIINHGTIKNNVYNFYLNLFGNIQHDGVWQNNQTFLNGTSDISIDASEPFNCYLFQNTISAKNIDIVSDYLHFINTQVDWGNCSMTFGNGIVNCEGGYFVNVTITADQLDFTMNSSAYLQDVTAYSDYVWLNGTANVGNNVNFFDNISNVQVEVMDVLQNYGNNNYTLTVDGDIINNGTIKNNAFNLYLNVSGSLTNNGIWQNNTTNLTGSGNQNLNFTMPFDGAILNSTNIDGLLSSGSALVFNGTGIDLNGDTLIMTSGNAGITLNGGYLREGRVIGQSAPKQCSIDLSGGAYFKEISLVFDDIELNGTFQFISPVNFFGNLIINGTLQNYGDNNYTLNVNGGVVNNGIIKNNIFYLYLIVQENIANKGDWQNQWTQLEGYSGSVDQTVELYSGHDITGQLRLFANNSSNFNWYKDNVSLVGNPDYSGATNQVLNFMVPVSASTTGTYNCLTDAGWSRNIYIDTVNTTLSSVDLKVFLEGPFNGTGMNTKLNTAELLPLNQPYNVFPWNYDGNESVSFIPNGQVVDWLLIEFRDATNAASADQTTQIERQAAFLLNDGRVVGMDGSSPLYLHAEVTNNLYVVVHHRNHLDIMSASALIESGGIYTYDFTSDSGNSYGGSLAVKNIADDLNPVYGMMGGDGNKDGLITEADHQDWPSQAGMQVGYSDTDYNLDAQVDNPDKNDTWVENLGNSVQYPQ